MKKQNSESNPAPTSDILQSGFVRIKINNGEFAEIGVSSNHVKVILKNAETLKNLSEKTPHAIKKIKNVHKLSSLMTQMGITVEFYDSKGEILSIGSGIHSILGNFEIKPTRIRKYF
ncbi:MAG: hypothetical protein ACP5UV_00790 [Thermoplasmata archaeon]